MQGIFMHLFAGEFIVLVSSWSWHSEKIPPQIFDISARKHKDDIDNERISKELSSVWLPVEVSNVFGLKERVFRCLFQVENVRCI